MEVEQPETLEGTGGKYVDKPGIYHIFWTSAHEEPVDSQGNRITNRDGELSKGVQVTAIVIAGTNPDQKDKSFEDILWAPLPHDDTAKQERAKRKQFAFASAASLVQVSSAGAKASVDEKLAVGRQSVVKLRFKQKLNEQTGKYEDTKRVEIAWSDIYHVDDPWVAKNSVPLDQTAIALIHASLRKIAKPAPSLADVAAAAPVSTPASAAVDVGDV